MTRYLARCIHGLEWVCADEIHDALDGIGGAGGIAMRRREVTFEAAGMAGVRTADDVFVDVGRAHFGPSRIRHGAGVGAAGRPTADFVARAVATLPWPEGVAAVAATRPLPRAPLLDVVAVVEGVRGLSRFDVEHAVGPVLERIVGGRHLVRTPQGREPGDPALTLRVAVDSSTVSGGVRLGARPAHRRPWKLDTGPGTLHPPMAAALVRLAAPRRGERVIDPFCGDGTIVVEAALAAPGAVVHGSDLDAGRVEGARRNTVRARMDVGLGVADAGRSRPGPPYDVVITNPPWNLAVGSRGALTSGLDPFWRALPRLLAPTGRLVVVADASLDVHAVLSRVGLADALTVRTRLAGRIADVVMAGQVGAPEAPLAAGLARWRRRALIEGVVTPTGF
ncbi:MAG: methyltransferase [Kineosporiaceae bacterium]